MKKTLLLLVLLLSSFLNFAQQPSLNLTDCADVPTMCFDLTVNTPLIMGASNPADYGVTYHQNYADAFANVNPITFFCAPTSPYTIYSRFASINGPWFSINSFTLADFQVDSLSYFTQCDNNNDGLFVFDLTALRLQIHSNNQLSYYTTMADAANMTNAITNPSAYTLPMQTIAPAIYVREAVGSGGCDVIYQAFLKTVSNCSVPPLCNASTSLCGSLNFPFENTVNVPSTGPLGCLDTTPNPRWFYMPISGAGDINLTLAQTDSNGFVTDVDYILCGPFTNQTIACNNFNQITSHVVSCDYSSGGTEYATIHNALPGQYYLILVTNFSNSSGMTTITQSNVGQVGSGTIGCARLLLNAFLDVNSNGIKEGSEPNFPAGTIQYQKNDDGILHQLISQSGIYEIYDQNPVNSYDVNFSVESPYNAMHAVSTPSYNNLTIPSDTQAVYYFPVTTQQNYYDLKIDIVPLSSPRPGFIYQNKIIYSNYGNGTISLGTINFTKDNNITIIGNSQSGTTATPTGFTYNFTDLSAFQSRSMTVSMQVPPIPTVSAGQILTNSASILSSTDFVPLNNTSVCSQSIINAYDPNDKIEAHGERIVHSSFTSDDYLYYTIRFENTGTTSAWNIKVTDVLDAKLDENSLRMINSSHNYQLDREGSNLIWTFTSIELPVSVANSTIGKGYITFKIKPKPGYAIGDIINNDASIYFDFNPAIVTNLFSTEFVAALAIDQFEKNDFILYPNPASGIVTLSLIDTQNNIASILVYDVLGKTIISQKSNETTVTVDVSRLTPGIYFIEATTDSNLKAVKKLLVK